MRRSSASRKRSGMFQCSSASRKFLNRSVVGAHARFRWFQCSSASRKFLNMFREVVLVDHRPFQCSSASRKFLNRGQQPKRRAGANRFSALQRAENSSIWEKHRKPEDVERFQCSSASRKFLNRSPAVRSLRRSACFSALQRAENSSMLAIGCINRHVGTVSVLFSEPKIPQLSRAALWRTSETVSVLFSEPKIPQWNELQRCWGTDRRFQCSSASRKFLNLTGRTASARRPRFQCSSASRKFLNADRAGDGLVERGFSALQRAENSSITATRA